MDFLGDFPAKSLCRLCSAFCMCFILQVLQASWCVQVVSEILRSVNAM